MAQAELSKTMFGCGAGKPISLASQKPIASEAKSMGLSF